MTPQRGAIPIELDKPRIVFYTAAATFLLVERYGFGFAAELYVVDRSDPDTLKIELKSLPALEYFLWIGLQDDAVARGETVTMKQVGEFIRPWSVSAIFNAVCQALVGATYVPPAPPGNAPASGSLASPATPKTPVRKPTPYTKGKTASTLKTRNGSRSQR